MQSLVFHARVPHQVMPSIQVMCARRGKALEKVRGPTFLRSTDVVGKQALKVCSAEPPGRLVAWSPDRKWSTHRAMVCSARHERGLSCIDPDLKVTLLGES